MPSTSKKQQRYFFAVKRCKDEGKCPTDQIKNTADSMSSSQINDFLKLKKSFKEWIEQRESN